MNASCKLFLLNLVLIFSLSTNAQTNNTYVKPDSLKYPSRLNNEESNRIALKKAKIDSLKLTTIGFPVLGVFKDTLFTVYTKIGSYSAQERAANITKRIHKLFKDDFLAVDSIAIAKSEFGLDLVYGEMIVMSISETDALWNNRSIRDLATEYLSKIKHDIAFAKKEMSIHTIIIKTAKIVGIILFVWLIIWLIGRAQKRLMVLFYRNKGKWLKNLSYKDYTYLSAEQEMKVLLFLLKFFRWFLIALLLYFALPIIFSILIFTRGWAYSLINLVWLPFKGIFIAVWHYLPNLITIAVIFIVMRYFIRLLKYFFNEIEAEKLKISGFHADWALPTFSIVRFILYAFMFVLIFPYLPGSDSNIFKGVSVFIGVLFSFGSSSAVANIVAGLVITYMRPFKEGDRIKLGDITGDVVEKTLLVTRLKTIKNEEITIPNSTILTGNITNYSSLAKNEGLILNTTVTIGYDVPWKNMHQALIDAALRTDKIIKEPSPFVLQTSLDDFYVSYQINAYTRDANSQIITYSELHQNIQDVCNERGIEILSPHYRYQRDGNATTIPTDYLNDDYQAPRFNVNIKRESEQ